MAEYISLLDTQIKYFRDFYDQDFIDSLASFYKDASDNALVSKFAKYQNQPLDVTLYPVTGLLTANGVQYLDSVQTGDCNIEVSLGSFNFAPGPSGNIQWAFFHIEAAFKAGHCPCATMQWKVQAKDIDTDNWQDLSDWTQIGAEGDNPACCYGVGISYSDVYLEGYAEHGDCQLTSVPFQYRALFRCDRYEEGYGKLKNDSYVRAIF
ncbi:MAG: hypothetical protein ACTSR2_06235 [Candidatus Hodarchaeales archaeon]